MQALVLFGSPSCTHTELCASHQYLKSGRYSSHFAILRPLHDRFQGEASPGNILHELSLPSSAIAQSQMDGAIGSIANQLIDDQLAQYGEEVGSVRLRVEDWKAPVLISDVRME